MPEFLTTKEVAALLRIKERKVYELVAEHAIPVSRMRQAPVPARWSKPGCGGGRNMPAAPRRCTDGRRCSPAVMILCSSGRCADPAKLAAFCDGSLDGLGRLAAGKAIAAGLHVYEPEAEGWNRGHLERAMPGMPVVLVEWAWRIQGWWCRPEIPKASPGSAISRAHPDAAPGTFRQRLLLDHLMRQAGLEVGPGPLPRAAARSEADVARDRRRQGRRRVCDRDGGAPVPPRLRAAVRERYDLAVWRRTS